MMDRKVLTGQQIVVTAGKLNIGGDNPPVMIAGPCAVESREQVMETALALKEVGVDILRGGVFKPRTSPYTFQGLGLKGLQYLKEAGERIGVPIVTELMDEKNLDAVVEYSDIVQIGSRNMYNYSLLKEIGGINKPVILKRGMSASIKEWVMAAEYIAAYGNKNIILCERGIRTFEVYTRNTLDLAAVPIMKCETGLPVIVDPSHGTGHRQLILPMSKAALACGANGLMIEVHIDPKKALSDGQQSITPEEYQKVYLEINKL
ncbi:3-deoxy-7-phosphoheptulonate synthase [Paramaledivibacter caminithermalis]|jgi:3-deoxy-7-phosphoheptulonate synthase|uniref:3-deoxy-D-arabinoheptulosonate-7-phosphate synthase n=1 Tax=Paramaledivibacter caminithermalis (strain DSM 15212 / CIP 107654 / DViRD3) TaxID=1121301 RepID=A0A1M6NQ25_PARC5|nr:3-deoxy-7-phosphoheptulonate synthase [Paramaledivibacter caminithermalis]SHJ97672.1 3-deoxy-D-arabinoheptulosonate-7-phosphate synthase [Paramaledivibacter caminithermalis DSM 15212]